jgi:hypothetical protein
MFQDRRELKSLDGRANEFREPWPPAGLVESDWPSPIDQPTTGERDMDTARITEILTDPVTLDLVEKQPIMQIAYAAADGGPRAVPLGYLLREGKFLFFTIPTSDKVAALHRDPRIALTIDVYPPPCCLLVRGTADLREEDGVPDEYLEASFRTMPEDQHAGFEEQVRALYDSMVRIEVTPTWVRLNDFQRTAPRAVERLVQAKQG